MDETVTTAIELSSTDSTLWTRGSLCAATKGDARHHVLFLIDAFNRTAGGAESTLIKLCRSLPPERYRCSVVTFKKGTGVEVNEHFSCPFYVFEFGTTLGWSAFKAARHLNQLIRAERVTIAHSFFPTADLWGGLVAKLAGCPILVSSRRDMGFLRQAKHRFAYRWFNGMFDQVHAVSNQVRDFSIREDHLDPSKVITLHNGVDLDEVESAKPLFSPELALGIQCPTHLVTTVGNLRPVKGIDVLLRAAAIVCKSFPKAVFLVVGEPHGQTYFDELKSLARALGVESNVRFLGLRNDPLSILKVSDVFCLPSRTEGLSNALLEAMACELPCVATNVGGNPELIKDGKNGFLVPSEQPDAIAARITELLRDRELARSMGSSGRRIVEDCFTVGHMVSRLVGLYDGLIEQGGLQ